MKIKFLWTIAICNQHYNIHVIVQQHSEHKGTHYVLYMYEHILLNGNAKFITYKVMLML